MKIKNRINPEIELEELHSYLTGNNSRMPKIPESVATILALVLTPKLVKSIKL